MFGWMSYYGPGELVAVNEKMTGEYPSSNAFTVYLFFYWKFTMTITKCSVTNHGCRVIFYFITMLI